jgi:hypothetical protein
MSVFPISSFFILGFRQWHFLPLSFVDCAGLHEEIGGRSNIGKVFLHFHRFVRNLTHNCHVGVVFFAFKSSMRVICYENCF